VSAAFRLRDAIRAWIPPWLADRGRAPEPLRTGFAVIWAWAAIFDAQIDTRIQGVEAKFPGFGTPTALPLIGRSRGILQGQGETDDNFAARLIPWLDRWRRAGSAEAIALSLHEYLSNHPRVRVVNRAGRMITCETDGTFSDDQVAWDWDSVTDPGNATHWWDLWIVVDQPPWPIDSPWGDGERWGGGLGFGHDAPREDVDAVLALIRQWKSEHSYVRSIIWTYDSSLFDPSTPTTMPDGTWGRWHVLSGGVAVPSGRSPDCRFWEGIT
jgi:hypothetical protein